MSEDDARSSATDNVRVLAGEQRSGPALPARYKGCPALVPYYNRGELMQNIAGVIAGHELKKVKDSVRRPTPR